MFPSQEHQNEHPQEPHNVDHEDEGVVPVPKPGDRAPTLGSAVGFPRDAPVLAVFLRPCGCPFAERTFRLLADLANRHRRDVCCVAVSQSPRADTDRWVVRVGGEWDVRVLADPGRELFHAWGLGLGSTWYAVNPRTLWHAWKLGAGEGIWNRESASGSRWQIGGAFAVDSEGIVRWSKPAQSADEVPDFKEALRALGVLRE